MWSSHFCCLLCQENVHLSVTWLNPISPRVQANVRLTPEANHRRKWSFNIMNNQNHQSKCYFFKQLKFCIRCDKTVHFDLCCDNCFNAVLMVCYNRRTHLVKVNKRSCFALNNLWLVTNMAENSFTIHFKIHQWDILLVLNNLIFYFYDYYTCNKFIVHVKKTPKQLLPEGNLANVQDS